MNNQTINHVVWSEQLSEPLRQALAQEIQRLAGEIVAASQPITAALTAANAAMLEAIRTTPVRVEFPPLKVSKEMKEEMKRWLTPSSTIGD